MGVLSLNIYINNAIVQEIYFSDKQNFASCFYHKRQVPQYITKYISVKNIEKHDFQLSKKTFTFMSASVIVQVF